MSKSLIYIWIAAVAILLGRAIAEALNQINFTLPY